MFGLKNKKAAKIKELEGRLTSLAKKVEENNHDIGELKGMLANFKLHNRARLDTMYIRVQDIEARQQSLRHALVPLQLQAVRTDPAVKDCD